MRDLTEQEVAEVETHKYFLSEKAGYDVGWDYAKQDWLENHASCESDCEAAVSKKPSVGSGSEGEFERVDSAQDVQSGRGFFKRLLERVGVL